MNLSSDELCFLLYHVGSILSIDKNGNCGEVFEKRWFGLTMRRITDIIRVPSSAKSCESNIKKVV